MSLASTKATINISAFLWFEAGLGMFSSTLGWEHFPPPLTSGSFQPFQCTRTYNLAHDGLRLIIVYDGVLCFHLSRLIRHREWDRWCYVEWGHHTQPLCLVTLAWAQGKECSRANTTAQVIFPHLDSEYIAFPLSSFQVLCLPLPSHLFVDMLIRKPGTPSTCNSWALCIVVSAPAPNHLPHSLLKLFWLFFLFIPESSVMWISVL